MATEAMVETTVQTAETVAEPAKEVAKKFPKGKTGLIIGGSALAVVGTYFLVKKVIVPACKKNHHRCYECTPVEEPEQAEVKEEAPEKETKGKKK